MKRRREKQEPEGKNNNSKKIESIFQFYIHYKIFYNYLHDSPATHKHQTGKNNRHINNSHNANFTISYRNPER